MTPISVEVVPPRQLPLLRGLLRAHLDEMSAMLERPEPRSDSALGQLLDRYRDAPTRIPCLFLSKQLPVGFALIGRDATQFPTEHELVEFAIGAQHRRRGLGSAALSALFERWPGYWRWRCHRHNAAALAFWDTQMRRFGPQTTQPAISSDSEKLCIHYQATIGQPVEAGPVSEIGLRSVARLRGHRDQWGQTRLTADAWLDC